MRGTASRPEGLQYVDEFIDRVEEKALLVYLSYITLAPITK